MVRTTSGTGNTLVMTFASNSRRRHLLPLLLIILTLAIVPTVFADTVCDHCGRDISMGRWVEVDGRFFHPQHFLCANCGQGLSRYNFYEEGGKYYHDSCYTRLFAPRCDHCDRPIKGEYVFNASGKYHPRCYDWYVAPRCALCGRVIEGEYVIDPWGNKIHAHHTDSEARCDYCQRFISPELTGGGSEYEDGRLVCSLCMKSAVQDMATANKLLAETASILQSYGMELPSDDLDLVLLDQDQLREVREENDPSLRGVTKFEKNFISFLPLGSPDITIYVLGGMPRFDFMSTVAHELMHVWLFEHGCEEMSSPLTEGSCNYAAFLVLSAYNDERAEFGIQCLMDNPDPDYGTGFRQVTNFVEDYDVEQWLVFLRRNRELPLTYRR